MTMRWRSPSGAQTASESGSSSAVNTSAGNALEGKGKESSLEQQQQHASSPHGGGESQSTAASSSVSVTGPILDDEPDTATSSSQMMEEEEITKHTSKNIPQTASTSTPDTILVSAADPSSDDPPYEEESSSGSNSSPDSGGGSKTTEASQSKDESASSSRLPSTSSSSSANTQPADEDESDMQEIPWRPQATQSTCEFTHTITNYSQKRDSGCKKAEYSATTIDEFGNRWRLIVYVNGNGRASNHHLSLFLQVADADDLPFGWKKAVSYVLTLEHPSGPNLSYAKRNPDKTFKLCPKAIDWGWSQFITSDRIQQEGFVQNDSLVVRASVTVKSSSVCIDLEDAELYLKCAVEEGKPEAVQLCLEQGASVNCQFKDDLYTPLHTACSSSTAEDVAAAAAAIASDEAPPPTTNSNNHHNNPGSMKVLNLLLEKGADGNACNKWRETPLLIAANNGHRAAVEALLKHGADPSLCSEAGWSALTFAAHKGYEDIVALLLRAGAPVNCRVTEDSSTPLHKACAGSKPGHLTAVILLLEHEADVHALNKWRETPLLTAANHGQAGAVEALLRAGADPCKCTDTGWSPLSIAAYKGHDDVVRLLLEEGAPTEEADPTLSALLQAATKGLPGTVELLLKHGADHTVTTKKGDTALSILVEQNLIDAAVEMVTAYKASVPRCSRDRKKVQRARLLINLRVKQQQKEGKLIVSDDDETDEEDLESISAIAQHTVEKSNANTKKKKMSAEEQAKLAEEALLLELEQEDAKRNKEVQEANKKSAKKRKKKERERQQKKEQEEKRLAEEKEKERKQRETKEAKERADKKRKEEEEKKRQQQYREQQRKEQQLREQQQREQQQKEQQRLKALQQKEQQQQQTVVKSASPAATPAEKRGKATKAKPVKRPQPVGLAPIPVQTSKQESATKAVVGMAPKSANQTKAPAKPPTAAQTTSRPAPAAGKNRGWETKQPVGERSKSVPKPTNGHSELGSNTAAVNTTTSVSPGFSTPGRNEKSSSTEFYPQPTSSPFSQQQGGNDINSMLNSKSVPQQSYASSESLLNGLSATQYSAVEVPAVALFRRDKVSELLQRSSMARNSNDPLSVVSEATIRKVLYRWMVRAAHESSPSVDCIIPSWHDFEQLTTFFQRQFISESRKGVNPSAPGSAMLSMESLKEAGSAMALLCHSLAKDIVDFCRRVDEQLPTDWVDSTIAMNVSMQNGAGSMVYLTWANRSQVTLSAVAFAKLRERYTGSQSRLLSAVFSAKIRYETKQLLSDTSSIDVCLPPQTQSTLSMKASVSAEIWSNPFSSRSGSVFWGQFADVDTHFGGLAPFSKENGGEDLLIRHGGSVSVVPPLDNMVASRYVHRMVDILDQTERDRIPVSFAVFCRAECFLDWNNSPSVNDLFMLDPRLRDRSSYLMQVEQLAAGQHSFFNETTGKVEMSTSGSLFVILQNEGGKSHYGVNDSVVVEIIRSMGGNVTRTQEPKLLTPMSFSAPEFVPSQEPHSFSTGYFDSHASNPVSPIRSHSLHSDFGQQQPQQQSLEFGAIGGTTISNAFAAQPASGGRRARGRLFDLVDDGEEDHLNDVDVVSGMLGNLNVDLFHNSSGGDQVVDIEAISLMGIGGPPPSGGLQPRNSRGRFG